MAPGVVSGRYARREAEIDLAPLAKRAGAALRVARAVAIDPDRRRIALEDGTNVEYDLASFDVGSAVPCVDLLRAVPVRPLPRLVEEVERAFARAASRVLQAVVVGGGAAGIEIAFALGRRGASVTVLEAAERILPGHPEGLARRAEAAASRGIRILTGTRAGGREAPPSDLVVLASGAAAPSLFESSGLPLDAAGFVRVEDTLRIEGHERLFAAGDCASMIAHPSLPKAGVHAVRQGPILAANLRAAIEGRPLQAYRPQRDFLVLLDLSDGTAIGSKWGISFGGRWAMRLKERIDRGFVGRFGGGGGR